MESLGKAVANLSNLTLRQLRQLASSLGLPRYSLATKEGLVQAIGQRTQIPYGESSPEAQITAAMPAAISTPISAPTEPTVGFTAAPVMAAVAEPSQTQVVFLPRDPSWAYCFWSVSTADRDRMASSGATSLCLRVADVTGLAGGTVHPHALQEVVVDSKSSEWFLPVPLPDRDYRIELGARLPAGGWLSLAFSSVARMPAAEPSLEVADAFVPFELESLPMTDAIAEATIPVAPAGQHERIYQQSMRQVRRVGSEIFQDATDALHGAGRADLTDSGAGLWASGRQASGVGGVKARQRSFWLVADAELIVYGATDPAATLSIGGETVPLSADGTFRLQVPFRDGQQLYAIEAVAADGEQRRHITLQFERKTPEEHTNPKDMAAMEWF
ncbi:DUF4912 domain-containing protein [Synechococcus sp. CS-1328]|uniref:DUF4912 domain-containing protein n=1 Tax=Synechococcus sp. CS-1328 TaxID=2847976 RepID=UPI00223B4C2F|nr:DUF4912 domain-containing protein [Synechococcus sp. CS-1328]MCT0226520.1 DUF4912 domain-containing protein [Synechococcus sp. CS-1328]